MKAVTFVSALLATAYAAPTSNDAAATEMTETALQPVAENPLYSSTKNGDKILPRFAQTKPKDGATRKTVKYGSYSVSMAKMLSTTKLVQGPCVGGCYVTAMEANIRYPSGVEANVDTGAWLHHIALFGSGAGGGSLWAAGNERPTIRLNNKEKFGLDFPSMFMLMIDLMVETQEAKNLTLEISYETVPKTGGYKGATMYWLTIGEPRAKQGVYNFTTSATVSRVTGSLLYAIGHMHDGGTNMNLYVSSKLVCSSVMHYNARAGYGSPVAGDKAGGHDMAGMHHTKQKRQAHSHGGPGMHISDPGACTDFGSVKSGDRLTATALYDANKYPLMTHMGKAQNLMGNMRVYIGGGSGGGLLGGLLG
jgi:hypothetical protein